MCYKVVIRISRMIVFRIKILFVYVVHNSENLKIIISVCTEQNHTHYTLCVHKTFKFE